MGEGVGVSGARAGPVLGDQVTGDISPDARLGEELDRYKVLPGAGELQALSAIPERDSYLVDDGALSFVRDAE